MGSCGRGGGYDWRLGCDVNADAKVWLPDYGTAAVVLHGKRHSRSRYTVLGNASVVPDYGTVSIVRSSAVHYCCTEVYQSDGKV